MSAGDWNASQRVSGTEPNPHGGGGGGEGDWACVSCQKMLDSYTITSFVVTNTLHIVFYNIMTQ